MREGPRRTETPGGVESLADRVYRPRLSTGREELRRASRWISLPVTLLGYLVLGFLGWQAVHRAKVVPLEVPKAVTVDLQDMSDGEAAPQAAPQPRAAAPVAVAPPAGALQRTDAPPLMVPPSPDVAPDKPPAELPVQDLSKVAVPATTATGQGGIGPAPGGAGEGTGSGTGPGSSGHGPKVVEYDFSEIEVLFKPEITSASYPAFARSARIQGTVKVEITVATDGVPAAAHALEGPPMLRSAAEAIALKYRFKPETQNGLPVIARFTLNVVFRLS